MSTYSWLDREIKKQRKQRRLLGLDAAELQEMAEMRNWDSPRRRRK